MHFSTLEIEIGQISYEIWKFLLRHKICLLRFSTSYTVKFENLRRNVKTLSFNFSIKSEFKHTKLSTSCSLKY